MVSSKSLRLVVAALALGPVVALPQTLRTRWAKDVTPANAHREYPRPQMVRRDWVNLNGLWDITILGPQPAVLYTGKILVPFPVESDLSGVPKLQRPLGTLAYRRTFMRPPKASRVLLHFGAVDWQAKIRVNSKEVGTHRGGYDPFVFDITDALTASGEQELTVEVSDPTDAWFQPRGKQVNKPGGIFYTPTSGIWQTVWLEPLPEASISRLKIVPNPVTGEVRVSAAFDGTTIMSTSYTSALHLRTEVLSKGKVVDRTQQPLFRRQGRNPDIEQDELMVSLATNTMKVPGHKLWSPQDPFLYNLRVALVDAKGREIDTVNSYFGFRDVSLRKDANGQPRIHLNGRPYFMFGPLDQGFWPDGLYTAPSDAAMKYDLEVTKRLGFNMIRKHVKVEPARWYYWCDKMGILVFQDMPSGDRFIGPNDPDITRTPESDQIYRTELQRMMDPLHNHPSIVTWVPFNEGWGQYKTAEITDWIKTRDPSRLVISASGWADGRTGDAYDVHVYPGPGAPPADSKRALVLGEFGGLGLVVPGHTWQSTGWGYQTMATKEELTRGLVELFRELRFLRDRPGLSAAVYTQTTDVETELNGLLTYDRDLLKFDEPRVRQAIMDVYQPPPVLVDVVPTSERAGVQWRYTTSQPGADWSNREFDDSSWRSGVGGFGTPETPGSVVRTRWDTKDIWLRRKFTLAREYHPSELLLRLSHDDDVEVYIDGHLVTKRRGWTTSYKLLDVPMLLGRGEHTLAIHCHQNQGGQYIDAGFVMAR
jgi:hypothetical protein